MKCYKIINYLSALLNQVEEILTIKIQLKIKKKEDN